MCNLYAEQTLYAVQKKVHHQTDRLEKDNENDATDTSLMGQSSVIEIQ